MRIRIYLAAIVSLAIALRGWYIDTRSLWFDEAFSWRLATKPLGDLLACAVQDHNPPLYYILLHGWTALAGDSPGALRLPSVLLGALTVLAGAWLAAEVACRRGPASHAYAARAALLAALLLALNTSQIRWGGEARMYALGTLLALVSTAILLRAIHARQAGWLWVAYAACMAALLYTHTYGVFSWMAHAAYVLVLAAYDACAVRRRTCAYHPAQADDPPPRPPLVAMRLIYAMLGGAAALALFSAWVPVLLMQRARVEEGFWTQPVTALHVLAIVNQICLTSEFAWGTFGADLLRACLLATGLAVLLRRGRAGEFALAASAVLPLAASVLVSKASTPILAPHYLLFAQSHLLVGIALVLARARGRMDFAAAACVAMAAMLVPHVNAQHALRIDAAPGARVAARLIDSRRGAAEPVVACTPLYYLPILYHLSSREHVYVHRYDQGWPRYYGTAVLSDKDYITTAELNQLAARRVWAVDMQGGSWGTRRLEVPPHWKQLEEHTFREPYPWQGALVVRLYEVAQRTQAQSSERSP